MSGRFMMHSRMRSNHVCTMKNLNRRSRKLHRLVVPIAAIPLALTALSGAIYGTVLAMNMRHGCCDCTPATSGSSICSPSIHR